MIILAKHGVGAGHIAFHVNWFSSGTEFCQSAQKWESLLTPQCLNMLSLGKAGPFIR